MILKDRNVQDYDSSKKEKFFSRDLTGGVPAIESVCGRLDKNSIYSKKLAGDSTDNTAVASAVNRNLKPRSCSLADFKRSSKRDFTIGFKTTDAYANIVKDNERADLIKHLMIDN